jgi:hypothetical protein
MILNQVTAALHDDLLGSADDHCDDVFWSQT